LWLTLIHTYIRYGFLLKAKAAEDEMDAYRYDPDNFENNEQIAMQNEWVAYLMMILGFFIMLVCGKTTTLYKSVYARELICFLLFMK
jgi:hypothetical protein